MHSFSDVTLEARLRISNGITSAFRTALKPPPQLNLVEWADTYRYLGSNNAEPGKWRTDRVEPARQPMLSISDPKVSEVTIMSCVQLMKHLAVNTPVKVIDGWKSMGDIVPGDVVFDMHGARTTVVAVSDVTTNEPCYKIRFSCGASIVASESHKWVVDDSRNRTQTVDYGVIKTTGEIANTFRNDRGNRYAIPVTKPIDNPFKSLPVDPYFLGVWLGDGHSYSTRITSHLDDFEIIQNLVDKGFGYELKNTSVSSSVNTREYRLFDDDRLPYRLTSMGLLKGSPVRNIGNHKHIPQAYLNASIEQRFELLQGLMDTDGTICKKGMLSFCTSSVEIRDGFCELTRSLGFKPVTRLVKTTRKDSYQITFRAYTDTPVFKLKRKLCRMVDINNPRNRIGESKRRRIVGVELVENVPVRCIAVDSPTHTFLCGREMIPTHNTELMINTAMFYMHQEPSPLMYVAPKKETAEAWSKERLVTNINVTPVLKDIFSSNRRGEGNTILQKQFPGGQISIVSAGNPTDLAMRPCRILLFDEVDKYEKNVGATAGGEGGEGDAIVIAWARSTTYGKRAKKVVACSPTVDGNSRIQDEYLKSNQCIFLQKCPHCGFEKELTWLDVKFSEPNPETGELTHIGAHIVCDAENGGCGKPWSEGDRLRSIRTGRYMAKRPEVTWHHGYKATSLASPFTPVETLAKEFMAALGNSQLLKAFYNTRMAQPWKEVGEQPDWKRLFDRREHYDMSRLPRGALMITCGIDVQRKGIFFEYVAWGRRKENWSIDCGYIEGSVVTPEMRDEIYRLTDRVFKSCTGVDMMAERTCIDSGDQTQTIYGIVREYPGDRLVAVKGEKKENLSTIIGTPTPVDVNIDGVRHSRGLMKWNVGSSVTKEQFYSWLNLKTPSETELAEGRLYPSGYCHFPNAYDEEYFKQITGEQYIRKESKRGFVTYEWDKVRKDNHFLDCRVYARAGAAMLQIDRMSEEDWFDRERIYCPEISQLDDNIEKHDTVPNRTVKPRRQGKWVKRHG